MVVLWSTSDWARAILDLPAARPVPTRTVLVPHGRVIAALQREIVRLGRADGLVGTRFVPVAEAAAAVLRGVGVPFAAGEEALREARLAALFRGDLRLERLDPAQLRAGRGWEEAFARTLRELEAAGISPRDLATRGPAGAPERDVAALWAAVERTAGRSLTTPRLLAEAAALLRGAPRRWPFEGPVLGVAAGDLSVVERDFLLAIPWLTLGLLAARPRSARYLARMTELLGPAAGEALATASPPAEAGETPPTELSRLGRRLFETTGEPARATGEPARSRSEPARATGEPDGTVRLEVHAGADEEIDAAAAWVAAEVAQGTPLEELAVIVPALDPWAALIEERLSRLPWPSGGGAPVRVPGGLPLCRSAAGARAVAVVRALQERLPVERLAEILPMLRAAGREPLSPREAAEVIGELGTAGGAQADTAGLVAWAERAEARAQAPASASLAALLRAVTPPLAALCGIARLGTRGAPLRQLWPALRALLSGWLHAPGLDAALAAAHAELEPLCKDGVVGALPGPEALEQIARALRAGRVPAARPGDAAVFIGTPRQARGLRFDATRVLGLAEGILPAAPLEDPVLPGAPAADRRLDQLHDLDRLARDTRRSLVLSAARRGLDREERGPSPVLAAAAAALERPLTPESARPPAPPPAWHAAAAPDEDLAPGPAPSVVWSGLVAEDAPPIDLPGFTPARPIEAADLQVLLECPQRFLLERVLGFATPAPLPARRRIEAEVYRGLLRRTLEAFYRAHGEAFGRRERGLPAWEALADQAARAAFAEHLARAPLAGAALQEHQRERLRRDARLLVAQDWCGGRPRHFVAAEAQFREALPAGEAPLHVRGVIGRLDIDGDRLLVRDVQAGRCHPRERAPGAQPARTRADDSPRPERDLPIALSALATASHAEALGLRVEAATTYAGVQVPSERAFRDDFEELAGAARGWLAAVGGLLRARAFPHTPREEDCVSCPFRAVCGRAAFAPTPEAAAHPAVQRFLELKGYRAASAGAAPEEPGDAEGSPDSAEGPGAP